MKFDEYSSLCKAISNLPHLICQWSLARNSVFCKLIYILRCVAPEYTINHISCIEDSEWGVIEELAKFKDLEFINPEDIEDLRSRCSKVKIEKGGIGLHDYNTMSKAAYIGAQVSIFDNTLEFIKKHTPKDFVQSKWLDKLKIYVSDTYNIISPLLDPSPTTAAYSLSNNSFDSRAQHPVENNKCISPILSSSYGQQANIVCPHASSSSSFANSSFLNTHILNIPPPIRHCFVKACHNFQSHWIGPSCFDRNAIEYSLVKEIGDGNCLFSALSRTVDGTPLNQMKFRKTISDYQRAHQEYFLTKYTEEMCGPNHYNNVKKDKVFGTQIDIESFARIYNYNVIIIIGTVNRSVDINNPQVWNAQLRGQSRSDFPPHYRNPEDGSWSCYAMIGNTSLPALYDNETRYLFVKKSPVHYDTLIPTIIIPAPYGPNPHAVNELALDGITNTIPPKDNITENLYMEGAHEQQTADNAIINSATTNMLATSQLHSPSSNYSEIDSLFNLGDRVWISFNVQEDKIGTIAFIGRVRGNSNFAGIILDDPTGKNNGSLDGIKYFTCPENYGIFASLDRIIPVKKKSLPDDPVNFMQSSPTSQHLSGLSKPRLLDLEPDEPNCNNTMNVSNSSPESRNSDDTSSHSLDLDEFNPDSADAPQTPHRSSSMLNVNLDINNEISLEPENAYPNNPSITANYNFAEHQEESIKAIRDFKSLITPKADKVESQWNPFKFQSIINKLLFEIKFPSKGLANNYATNWLLTQPSSARRAVKHSEIKNEIFTRMWRSTLNIDLAPSHQIRKCVCGASLDPKENHLKQCANMQIKNRHDNLVGLLVEYYSSINAQPYKGEVSINSIVSMPSIQHQEFLDINREMQAALNVPFPKPTSDDNVASSANIENIRGAQIHDEILNNMMPSDFQQPDSVSNLNSACNKPAECPILNNQPSGPDRLIYTPAPNTSSTKGTRVDLITMSPNIKVFIDVCISNPKTHHFEQDYLKITNSKLTSAENRKNKLHKSKVVAGGFEYLAAIFSTDGSPSINTKSALKFHQQKHLDSIEANAFNKTEYNGSILNYFLNLISFQINFDNAAAALLLPIKLNLKHPGNSNYGETTEALHIDRIHADQIHRQNKF